MARLKKFRSPLSLATKSITAITAIILLLFITNPGISKSTAGKFKGTVNQNKVKKHRFSVPNGAILYMDLANNGDKLINIQVRDSKKRIIADKHLKAGESHQKKFTLNSVSGGGFDVRIRLAVAVGKSKYEAKFSYEMQNDGGKGMDAGQKSNTALAVQIDLKGPAINGYLNDYDQEDWYSFSVPRNSRLNFHYSVNAKSNQTRFLLYDNKTKLIKEIELSDGGKYNYRVTLKGSYKGICYLRIVSRVFRGESNYSIKASNNAQKDGMISKARSARAVKDAGGNKKKAMRIKLRNGKNTIAGHVGDFDREDWYILTIPKKHYLLVAATSASGPEMVTGRIYIYTSKRMIKEIDIKPDNITRHEKPILVPREKALTLRVKYTTAGGGKNDYKIESTLKKIPLVNKSFKTELKWDLGTEVYQTEEVQGSGMYHVNKVRCKRESPDSEYKEQDKCKEMKEHTGITKMPMVVLTYDKQKEQWNLSKLEVYSYYIVRQPADWAFPDVNKNITNNPDDGLENPANTPGRKGYWRAVIGNLKKYKIYYNPVGMKWWIRGSTLKHEKTHNDRYKDWVTLHYRSWTKKTITKLNKLISQGRLNPFDETAMKKRANAIIAPIIKKEFDKYWARTSGNNSEEIAVHEIIRKDFWVPMIEKIQEHAKKHNWK